MISRPTMNIFSEGVRAVVGMTWPEKSRIRQWRCWWRRWGIVAVLGRVEGEGWKRRREGVRGSWPYVRRGVEVAVVVVVFVSGAVELAFEMVVFVVLF